MVSEQIYVHSKLMIVDDRIVILGSANINDRSMRGDRDSEIAALVKDTQMVEGTMGGRMFKVGMFAHELRKQLWAEHLGLPANQINATSDPIRSVDLWQRI